MAVEAPVQGRLVEVDTYSSAILGALEPSCREISGAAEILPKRQWVACVMLSKSGDEELDVRLGRLNGLLVKLVPIGSIGEGCLAAAAFPLSFGSWHEGGESTEGQSCESAADSRVCSKRCYDFGLSDRSQRSPPDCRVPCRRSLVA